MGISHTLAEAAELTQKQATTQLVTTQLALHSPEFDVMVIGLYVTC